MSIKSVKELKKRSRIYSKVSEIEVYYKREVPFNELPKVSGSDDAEAYFRHCWGKRKMDHIEQFMVLYLNRSNRIQGWSRISSGGIAGTVADPKVIFQIALKANASSIIMAHNHPSGETKPSENDIHLTNKLRNGGKLLDLPILDHIILTTEGQFSFADHGML